MSDSSGDDYYYVHDHLYSPAALLEDDGDVVERCECDACGKATIRNPQYERRAFVVIGTCLAGDGWIYWAGILLQFNIRETAV